MRRGWWPLRRPRWPWLDPCCCPSPACRCSSSSSSSSSSFCRRCCPCLFCVLSVRAIRQVCVSTTMHLVVINHGQRWNRITELEDGSGGQTRLPSVRGDLEKHHHHVGSSTKQWTQELKGVLNRLTLLWRGVPYTNAHFTRALIRKTDFSFIVYCFQ